MFLGRFPIALSTLAGSQSILSGSPEYPSRLPDGLIGLSLSDGPIRSQIALLGSQRALSAIRVLDAPNRLSEEPIRAQAPKSTLAGSQSILAGSPEYPSRLPDSLIRLSDGLIKLSGLE